MSERIRINEIKLRPDVDMHALEHKIKTILKLGPKDSIEYQIVRRSLDARHKPDIFYVYTVDVKQVSGGKDCNAIYKKMPEKYRNQMHVQLHHENEYQFPKANEKNMNPVIIGFGPAGMFAAIQLAKAGLCPIVFERGDSVEKRQKCVNHFWDTGVLDVESNVQFGEGGAGTFSDGKLNTMIKDPTGRIRAVLKLFVEFGADTSILYMNKPHIGTDVLCTVVKNMREFIIAHGGEVHFRSKFCGIEKDAKNHVCGVKIENMTTHDVSLVPCKQVCIAIGHSARDTFPILLDAGCMMTAKAFAVGLRMEHPQSIINYNAYGDAKYKMPAADYKVTYQTQAGRGVYSFCMCPGGYVVNASSELEHLAVNGMSYSGRDGDNANSAIIVTVTPEDFGNDIFAGMQFQRKLEKNAYRIGNGNIPVQLYADFSNNQISTGFGRVQPHLKGAYSFGNLREIFSEDINQALIEGVQGFGKRIQGFDMEDAVFSGVESRTSSPVRILRDEESLQSPISGLYPCGEGAGYAGGITSAAVDGIKVAEKIATAVN